jgi:hypothetical protein
MKIKEILRVMVSWGAYHLHGKTGNSGWKNGITSIVVDRVFRNFLIGMTHTICFPTGISCFLCAWMHGTLVLCYFGDLGLQSIMVNCTVAMLKSTQVVVLVVTCSSLRLYYSNESQACASLWHMSRHNLRRNLSVFKVIASQRKSTQVTASWCSNETQVQTCVDLRSRLNGA